MAFSLRNIFKKKDGSQTRVGSLANRAARSGRFGHIVQGLSISSDILKRLQATPVTPQIQPPQETALRANFGPMSASQPLATPNPAPTFSPPVVTAPVVTPPQQTALQTALQTQQEPAPMAPVVDPRADLAKRLALSNAPSQDEIDTQGQIDKLIESTRLGQFDQSQEVKAMEFITGAQSAIERRSLGLAEPLNAKLARLQSQRTLDRAGIQGEINALPVAQEGFTLGKDQVRYDSAGNVVAGSSGGGESGTNPDVIAWSQAIARGDAKLTDAPQELRGAILQGLPGASEGVVTPQQQQLVQRAQTALDTFSQIFENPALDRGALNRNVFKIIPGSNSADLDVALGTIKGMIGVEELQKMREASPTGGALGQVTKNEIDFLQGLQGSLKSRQGDAILKENLTRVRDAYELIRLVNSPDGTEGIIGNVPSIKQGDKIIGQIKDGTFMERRVDGSWDELSFNTVGSDTNSAENIANAIMQVESGGRQIAGASGEFGAFQFMPATWKIISRQIAGQVLQQTPENERAVAVAKIQDLISKGYGPKEIALIWNTSLGGSEKPLVKKGVNSKGVAYDSGGYANKVLLALG